MAWWLWIVVGLGLLVFELATPGGLFALFFGAAAIVVGLLAGVGLAGPVLAQWVLFSGLSIGALALLRGRLRDRLTHRPIAVDTLVGETAVPLADLEPNAVGKAELRGSSWEARNVAGVPLAAGQRCRVVRVDGLALCIGPEEGRRP
jgi:membrane protein implicated in regulation of membrane protease activity